MPKRCREPRISCTPRTVSSGNISQHDANSSHSDVTTGEFFISKPERKKLKTSSARTGISIKANGAAAASATMVLNETGAAHSSDSASIDASSLFERNLQQANSMEISVHAAPRKQDAESTSEMLISRKGSSILPSSASLNTFTNRKDQFSQQQDSSTESASSKVQQETIISPSKTSFQTRINFDPSVTYCRAYIWKKAHDYYVIKDWKKALGQYNLILKRDPKDGEALERSGVCHQNLGEYKRAAAFFIRGAKQEHTPSLLSLGTLLWTQGEAAFNLTEKICEERAWNAFQRAATKDSSSLFYMAAILHCGKTRKNIPAAKKYYGKVLDDDNIKAKLKGSAAKNLALIFLRGEDEGKRDLLRAMRYFCMAEEYGLDCSQSITIAAELIIEQTCIRNL